MKTVTMPYDEHEELVTFSIFNFIEWYEDQDKTIQIDIERGADMNHTIINFWVDKYLEEFKPKKQL